jgi:hypothetical protein
MTAEQQAQVNEEISPLNSEEIVALKQKLHAENWEVFGRLCAWIAVDILQQDEEEHIERKSEQEARGNVYATTFKPYESREDFAFAAAELAVNGWFLTLKPVIESPDSDWPEDYTPPHHIAVWLQEMEDNLQTSSSSSGDRADG